jgi:hypothetical protein
MMTDRKRGRAGAYRVDGGGDGGGGGVVGVVGEVVRVRRARVARLGCCRCFAAHRPTTELFARSGILLLLISGEVSSGQP